MNQSEPRGEGLIGTVLDGAYRLTRVVCEGGMGTVYEAVQLRLNKRVAVKIMVPELAANTEALARFRREVEVTSQLAHPHVTQLLDFGAAPSGEPYLVMEYLDGEDLELRLRRVGHLPLEAAIDVVRQVASALTAIHAKGIVHRDLKPANVFLLTVEGATDFAKLLDFGISKVRTAKTKLTRPSIMVGTPCYMSPEQAMGKVDDVDHRSDQWALACIAWEMLTGQPPFPGTDLNKIVHLVVHTAPPPFAPTVPGAGAEVEGVLRRALAKRQADRFPTISAFSRALEGAAGPRSAGGPSRRPSRLAWAVTLAATAAILVGAALYFRPRWLRLDLLGM